MTARLEDLQRAFGAETALPLSVWTYATLDPLEAVLAKGYFKGCLSQFRLGDLLLCATDEVPNRHEVAGEHRRRRALLMVTAMDWRGIETRLVQDLGTPARTAAGLALAARRRRSAVRLLPVRLSAPPPRRRRALRLPRRRGRAT